MTLFLGFIPEALMAPLLGLICTGFGALIALLVKTRISKDTMLSANLATQLMYWQNLANELQEQNRTLEERNRHCEQDRSTLWKDITELRRQLYNKMNGTGNK
jgi:hypothetical protein